MPKKKKIKIPSSTVKFIWVCIFGLIVGFAVYWAVNLFIIDSEYFRIKSIQIDPALTFLKEQDLASFKGKSIFRVDLTEAEKRFHNQYPQTAELKILKRYPDRLWVEAKKRTPLAFAVVRNSTVLIDEQGFVMPVPKDFQEELPMIYGIKGPQGKPLMGNRLETKEVRAALKIIETFAKTKGLSSYHIAKLKIDSLSQIYLYFSNDLSIILDEEGIEEKMKILSFMLAKQPLDPKQIKYIDLRFKEPLIAKKP